jgi:hypothetical protein
MRGFVVSGVQKGWLSSRIGAFDEQHAARMVLSHGADGVVDFDGVLRVEPTHKHRQTSAERFATSLTQ